jgi:fatty-acyl-CoA synthase
MLPDLIVDMPLLISASSRLIVTRRPGSQLDRETLLELLGPAGAGRGLPDDVVFVPAMPLTGTGTIHKLTRREQVRDDVLPTAVRSPAAD